MQLKTRFSLEKLNVLNTLLTNCEPTFYYKIFMSQHSTYLSESDPIYKRSFKIETTEPKWLPLVSTTSSNFNL